jgi:hypothetical protein
VTRAISEMMDAKASDVPVSDMVTGAMLFYHHMCEPLGAAQYQNARTMFVALTVGEQARTMLTVSATVHSIGLDQFRAIMRAALLQT